MRIPMEARVEAFRRFYRRENERPLLGFFVGSEYPLFRYEASRSLPTDRALRPEDFEVAPYLDDSDRLFELHEACGGDFIWAATAFWGVPWVEAALGCELWASHDTGSIHTRPPAGFGGADSIPAFDPSNPWVVKMVEFYDALAERSGGRYPIGTTRMRGVSDLLSALYGGQEFVVNMLTDEEDIEAACDRLTDFWLAMARRQVERIPPFHGGVGSFYYSLWAPAGTVWAQEDAAALLSPDLFDRFIAPRARRIADALDGCVMHMHPTGHVPWARYLEMDIDALELHIDAGGPNAEALNETHRAILAERPLIVWGDLKRSDLDTLFGRLPAQGLAINTVVDGPETARRIRERYVGEGRTP